MLRILSLNYEYPPIGGGGGNAHQHLIEQLSKHTDLQVTLVVPTLDVDGEDCQLHERVRKISLPIRKQERLYWKRDEVLRYLWQHSRFLSRHLRESSYDVCHAFFGFPTGVLAWWNRKRFATILSVRGSDVPGYNKRFGLDHALLRPLMKRVYGDASSVVANSGGLKALYESQFPGSFAPVIPNGIDTDRYQPVPFAERMPRSVITVARLIPRKGIDLLLRACHRVLQEGIELQCHIVGAGPQREPLERLASELGIAHLTEFHGDVQRDQIPAELARHSAFVLPSYAEGMSNAALEAMACGLPLLLTDTGGSAELIDGNGVIVPTGDDAAIATTLIEWFRHPEGLQALGERSRARAEPFSWSEVARQYVELYHRVAGR